MAATTNWLSSTLSALMSRMNCETGVKMPTLVSFDLQFVISSVGVVPVIMVSDGGLQRRHLQRAAAGVDAEVAELVAAVVRDGAERIGDVLLVRTAY